ncbi:hypothetical protein [Roseinatronobacter bogoriensis]|uniref:hypothetical protein n=1 Tax=Roseinatronobacter bogoriensis TaxID=119542 RepID=UPI001064DEE8|nr:hypothetical protein [Rhodobaca bogoriensis]MBB4207261.1 hypothetical protein [Rhodobaca bogoriensis DSM 18756]TDY65760.1 hypothetical protein EV660_11728 [Rhodobaca bogoriensis DSM 18756]
MSVVLRLRSEDDLRAAMAADARAIEAATAHWREDVGVGRKPANIGKFHAGSATGRLLGQMAPGVWYCSTRAGEILGVPSMRAADVLRQLARAGHVARRDCPELGRPVYARDA